MSETTLGIQVRIETQADVAAVGQAQASFAQLDEKLGGVIKNYDLLSEATKKLARAQADNLMIAEAGSPALKQFEKEIEAVTAAAEKAAAASKKAAEKATQEAEKQGEEIQDAMFKGLSKKFGEDGMLAGAMNLWASSSMFTSAFAAGTAIGEALGKGVEDYFSGDRSLLSIIGIESDTRFDIVAQNWRVQMRNIAADYDELLNKLSEPPGTALLDYLAEVKAAAEGAKSAIDAVADADKTTRGDDNAAEDQARADAVARGELTPEDAAREKAMADAQREVNERGFARGQKVDEYNADADALDKQKGALGTQEERARAALGIDRTIEEQKLRAQAELEQRKKRDSSAQWDATAWEETERRTRADLKGKSGFDDIKSGKDEGAALDNLKKDIADKEAEMRKRAQAIEDQDTRDAAADAASWNKADRKIKGIDSKEAAGKEKSESDGASKEAAQAGKDASAAGKEVDASTKGLSTGIKALADAVKTQGTQGKAWAAELSKLSSTLNDGASEAELTAIKGAMERISSTSSEAFNAMAKSVESQANSLQTIVSKYDALLRKCESLESKINSMR